MRRQAWLGTLVCRVKGVTGKTVNKCPKGRRCDFQKQIMYISLWPTLFIRLVTTFIANLYTLLSGDPGNLAELVNVARIVSVPTGAKNSDACLLMCLPGVHRQK